MSENMKCPDCAAPLVVGTRCAACGWYALGHSPMEERLATAESDLAALRAKVEALAGELRRRAEIDQRLGDDFRDGTAVAYGAAADALAALLPGGAPGLTAGSTVEGSDKLSANSGGDAESHDLYETGDADAPRTILDRNGEVTLGLCRRCGQAEADLAPTCPGRRKP